MESRTLRASAAPAKAETDVHRPKGYPRVEPDERVTKRHQATAYRGWGVLSDPEGMEASGSRWTLVGGRQGARVVERRRQSGFIDRSEMHRDHLRRAGRCVLSQGRRADLDIEAYVVAAIRLIPRGVVRRTEIPLVAVAWRIGAVDDGSVPELEAAVPGVVHTEEGRQRCGGNARQDRQHSEDQGRPMRGTGVIHAGTLTDVDA